MYIKNNLPINILFKGYIFVASKHPPDRGTGISRYYHDTIRPGWQGDPVVSVDLGDRGGGRWVVGGSGKRSHSWLDFFPIFNRKFI